MPTESGAEVTRLHLSGAPGRGCRLRGGGGVFRAVLQRRHASGATVALVPERALLLAGDDVALDIEVDPGLTLELVETGGTVAYDMRGGAARWSTVARVGADARLLHRTLPWVSAAGSDVRRSLDVDLDAGARALLRETLVLGRHGEEPGRLVSRSRVSRGGVDVLVEELDARDLVPHRVLDQVACFGEPPPTDARQGELTRLDLASGDVLWRRLDSHAHAAAGALDRRFADLAPTCLAAATGG